jgi:hypothetical protein
MKAHEILTLIVFLFLSNPIIAQYRLSLSVADGNREALSGVTVVLYAKDTLRAGEISDAKGIVKFRDIPGDNYLMRVSMIGYKAYEQKLNVNRNITLPTIIIREDTSRLAEVTVTANRCGPDSDNGLLVRLPSVGTGSEGFEGRLRGFARSAETDCGCDQQDHPVC